MGQQQLLLLVLSIVLVGLAVVVGISAFQENQHTSQRDVATAAALRYVGDMIAWRERPVALGGGGGSLVGFSPDKAGYAVAGTCTGVSPNRPYVAMGDGSKMVLSTSAPTTSGRALAVWVPAGVDCNRQWKWVFHVYLEGATLSDVTFLGCRDNNPTYPWSNGGQCAPGW